MITLLIEGFLLKGILNVREFLYEIAKRNEKPFY